MAFKKLTLTEVISQGLTNEISTAHSGNTALTKKIKEHHMKKKEEKKIIKKK